jgi:hypothetical protein
VHPALPSLGEILIPPPRTLLLDDDGEVDVTTGNIVFATGAEAIKINVRNRLQVFREEWFLDEDEGMPYYQTILGKNRDAELVRAAFRDRILSTPAVTALDALSFTLNTQTRELEVVYRAQTDEGLLADTVLVGVQ